MTKLDNELQTEQDKSRRLAQENEKLKSELENDSFLIKKFQALDEKLLSIQNKLISQMSKFA